MTYEPFHSNPNDRGESDMVGITASAADCVAVILPITAVLFAGTGTILVALATAFVIVWLVAHGAALDDAYLSACLCVVIIGGCAALRTCLGGSVVAARRVAPSVDVYSAPLTVARLREAWGVPPRDVGEMIPTIRDGAPRIDQTRVVVPFRSRDGRTGM